MISPQFSAACFTGTVSMLDPIHYLLRVHSVCCGIPLISLVGCFIQYIHLWMFIWLPSCNFVQYMHFRMFSLPPSCICVQYMHLCRNVLCILFAKCRVEFSTLICWILSLPFSLCAHILVRRCGCLSFDLFSRRPLVHATCSDCRQIKTQGLFLEGDSTERHPIWCRSMWLVDMSFQSAIFFVTFNFLRASVGFSIPGNQAMCANSPFE